MTNRMTRYSIAVYLMTALILDAAYQFHLTLGGDRFKSVELLSTFVFFVAWLPLMPLVVWLARRYAPMPGKRLRALEIHFFAALALSFVTLFVHKLFFCPAFCYVQCITYFRVEAWMGRWFLLDYFIYFGVVAAIWIALLTERMREREARAAAIERELASAELRVMNAHANPEALIEMFGAIGARIAVQPAQAERMIMLVAEYLRLNLRALGASDLTVADDLELLRAWIAMERERTGSDLRLDVQIDAGSTAASIVMPQLQPMAAEAMRGGATLVVIRSVGLSEMAVSADGIEIGRIAA